MKYLHIAYTYWRSSFVSFSEVLISVFQPFLIMFIQFVLFSYIYSHKHLIGGFTFEEIITYIYLSGLIFTLIDSSRIAYEMEELIISGRFTNIYVLPIDFYFYMFSKYTGENIARSLPFILAGIVFYIAGIIKINIFRLPLFPFLLLEGFILNFTIYFLLSMLVFKFIRLTGLIELFRFFFDVAGGRLFPLSFLPSMFRVIARFSPFALSIYLPVKYLMGKQILKIELGILIILSILCMVGAGKIFEKTVKRYEGFGG